MTYVTKYVPIKIRTDGSKEEGMEFSDIDLAEHYLLTMVQEGEPFKSIYIDEYKNEDILNPAFKLGGVPQKFLVKIHYYYINSIKHI